MYALLLIVIYLAFVSLGLGDSLLGSAWPVMHGSLGVPVVYAGFVSVTISFGTICSSLLSNRLTFKFGSKKVVLLGVLLTAAALFGFSVSGSFLLVWILAIPYGLGSGAVDATINNYVALNYKARHMNLLHCFWGVGAMVGPYVMGLLLVRGFEWTDGYRTIVFFQLFVALSLLVSFPLWKKPVLDVRGIKRIKPLSEVVKIRGVRLVLPALFAYCAIEATTILWASTFLVRVRGLSPETAAGFASLFFIGITGGRFLSAFILNAISVKTMIKAGICLVAVGIAFIFVRAAIDFFSLLGLVVVGLGCAPIFPSIIHSTPQNFGEDNSGALVGVQMASAYSGSALTPPLFGLLAGFFGLGIFPVYLTVFVVMLFVLTTLLNRAVGQAAPSQTLRKT